MSALLTVPSEPPVIQEANSTSSTSITLKWSEVTQLNAALLLGYAIVYKKLTEKFKVDFMKSVVPTPREATIDGLEKFTNYTIRVFAFTRNGNGVPSRPVSFRTQEDGRLSKSEVHSVKNILDLTWIFPLSKTYLVGGSILDSGSRVVFSFTLV